MKESNDDLSIWNAFLSGDDGAYETIYRQHVRTLYLHGMTLTSDEELVRDCIQDVFIRLYKHRKRLGTTDNIRLYLLSALKNTLLNAFRKQNTYREFLKRISYEGTSEQETVIEQIVSKEHEVDRERQIDFFWPLLTGRQKEVIYYRFVEGMNLTEIARRLEIDYHSTANIIQRALKKLRKFYLKSD